MAAHDQPKPTAATPPAAPQRPRRRSALSEFWTMLDFGALVPDAYARYRPALSDGIRYFLANLQPARSQEILGRQLALAADASIGERLVAIAECCPALHKLCQVLARDRRLPATLRALLQRLETMPASQDLAQVCLAIEAEIGAVAAHGLIIDEPPLAEASVAIVQPFRWHDAGGGGERHGVFKLLKAGIEARLEEELDLLGRVGALLDERCRHYGLPAIDYAASFAQVRALLAREVHLDTEQAHLRQARAAYAPMPRVIVPEVLAWSTPRLTAMERIFGRKVTEALDLGPHARRRLAALIADALLAWPIWMPGGGGLFHADPHAGNLVVTADGRLGILDWSLTGRLAKTEQVEMTQILLGAVTFDPARILDAVCALSAAPIEGSAIDGAAIDRTALDRVVARHLARLGCGVWPSLGWLTALMDDALIETGARFSADLVMFRKVLQTLRGVVADVSEQCRVDLVLAGRLIRQLAREGMPRWWTQPASRRFATHLSNLDLAQLAWQAPLIGTRSWLGLTQALFTQPQR